MRVLEKPKETPPSSSHKRGGEFGISHHGIHANNFEYCKNIICKQSAKGYCQADEILKGVIELKRKQIFGDLA